MKRRHHAGAAATFSRWMATTYEFCWINPWIKARFRCRSPSIERDGADVSKFANPRYPVVKMV
jgi:hypothetical protein